MNPCTYNPTKPDHFIGGAAKIGRILTRKIEDARKGGTGPLKLLLYGPPGVGKSKLAEMVGRELAGHPVYVETVNGRGIMPGTVSEWIQASHYRPIGWSVKIIEEVDTARNDTQDLLLTYLDAMKEGHGVVCTSNLEIRNLTERFQTRLQQFKVQAPTHNEVATFLRKHWHIAEKLCHQIALGCGGNVRAALLDTQSALDAELA
jgi:replication-associated recombination protein RarA